MEENKELLTEGGKITGTLNYKDFLAANPEWTVKLVDGKIVSDGAGKVKAISPYLKDNKEASQEAYRQACRSIRAIEEDMFDHKPNEIKEVISDHIWWDINSYFGKKFAYGQSDLTPYEAIQAAIAYAKRYSYHGASSNINTIGGKDELLTKQHQAAYAEAVIYKYFNERIKDSTSRRSGLKRALNDMSEVEREDARTWLKDHVTDIYFSVPRVDSIDAVEIYGKDGFVDEDKTNEAITKLENLTNLFHKTYPNAIHQVDYTYRNTSGIADPRKGEVKSTRGRKNKFIKSDDSRKDLWNWMASVSFDTKIADIPDNVKNIIVSSKRQAKVDTKSMQEMANDYTISSVPLAQAILSLFNNDFNFYKKNDDNTLAGGSDALIDDYTED